jgi:hypothetical protein
MELGQLAYVARHFSVDVVNTLIHNPELFPDFSLSQLGLEYLPHRSSLSAPLALVVLLVLRVPPDPAAPEFLDFLFHL